MECKNSKHEFSQRLQAGEQKRRLSLNILLKHFSKEISPSVLHPRKLRRKSEPAFTNFGIINLEESSRISNESFKINSTNENNVKMQQIYYPEVKIL